MKVSGTTVCSFHSIGFLCERGQLIDDLIRSLDLSVSIQLVSSAREDLTPALTKELRAIKFPFNWFPLRERT